MQQIDLILGSKTKIKLLRYLYENKDWQFNLSDIAKRIEVDKGTISRVIKDLEKNKIIIVKRSGKLLLFSLNLDNKLVKNLLIKIFKLEAKLK